MFSNNTTPRKPVEAPNGNDTSLIARGTSVSGDVQFAGSLHLDGFIDGSVHAGDDEKAVFTLSAEGRVTGEIDVPNAVINGTVKGNIHAAERLELAAQACIEGDVHYRVLEMAAGAQVNGRMVHQAEQTPRQLSGPEAEEDAEPALMADD